MLDAHRDGAGAIGAANINSWIAVAFYVIAGLGWVLPAMPIVRWMPRPSQPSCEERRPTSQ
jgi:hypothetical protein